MSDRLDRLGKGIAALSGDHRLFVSTASLWEIAIKVRLGKLPLKLTLDLLPGHLGLLGVEILHTDRSQALAEARRLPDTRDPFDRLLLAICQVEDQRLLTIDDALTDHPLAWRAPAA